MLTHADVWLAIDRLAAKHGYSASGLARRAGLDPTTFNRSKRITREGKARWPSTESIAKILSATDTNLGDLALLLAPEQAGGLARKVPLIGFGEAAQEGLFDAEGRPRGDLWDEMEFPFLFDTDAYALQIGDDAMAPIYRAGDIIILSPGAALRRGDRVVVKQRPGRVCAGQFIRRGLHRIQLTPLADGTPETALGVDQVAWVARIVWASQ